MGDATVLDGMQEEGQQVGAIVDKNIAIVAKLGRADGFAPMDLFTRDLKVLPSMRMVECLRVVQQSSQEKMAEKSLPR
jgi:hypothetical protein